MHKIFGFSRRRTKLGRLIGHIGDPSQGGKSPMKPTEGLIHSIEENGVMASASGRSEDYIYQCSPGDDLNKCIVGNFDNWMVLSTSGDKPTPRFHHAACVAGNKMVVVGGESSDGMLDDTKILDMDKFTWAAAAPKAGLALRIPACRGHCLVSSGKTVLLVGGKTDVSNDKVSVFSFDTVTESWSSIDAKGDVPAARSGHTVIRAGPVLILFGGEDAKGKKLNDLHMFDLKSLTWLPLRYTGTGPSPRSNHIAALCGDKVLVFGGQGKSRTLNDLYSLDFKTMVWMRMKTKGHHPSPRAGCTGTLYGAKWYIIGGGSKKKRCSETLVFDVSRCEWSVCSTSQNSSISSSIGFSLVDMHQRDKLTLVAFGGEKNELSNQVEILVLIKNDLATSWRSAPDADLLSYEDYLSSAKELASHISDPSPHVVDSTEQRNIVTPVEHLVSGRKSLPDSSLDPNVLYSSSSLRKQLSLENSKFQESGNPAGSSLQERGKNQEIAVHMDIGGILANNEEHIPTMDVRNWKNDQLYEAKIAALTRRNSLLEEKLTAALATQEDAEKNLFAIIKSKQDIETKLNDALKEVEVLKEKLASMELAQEEANSVSNIAHSDNVRLEHDVAFLKAILDDTQKELHSTRGVLAGEKARAFQLQVEVFQLKQRLQSLDGRSPTPRKPYRI